METCSPPPAADCQGTVDTETTFRLPVRAHPVGSEIIDADGRCVCFVLGLNSPWNDPAPVVARLVELINAGGAL